MRCRARAAVSSAGRVPGGLPTWRMTSGSLSRAMRSPSAEGRSRRNRSRGVSITEPDPRILDCLPRARLLFDSLCPLARGVIPEEAAMRRTLISGSALFLLLALGCPPAADAQTRDDTLIYALQSDVDSWDPPNSVLREAIILGYHVFDHLAVRDLKTRRVVPNLALSWKALNDTTWEVKLRQGVKFHDGSPFTARDVKATFERVLDPTKKMTARGNHAKIKSVEIVDDHTVKFHTDGPYPIFVERLTALVMASEKVIKDKGHEWMQEHPIGTGPYKLVKWDRKHEHLLVRNDEYWGPKAPYKYVRIRIIPEQATQIAELISGGVDVIKAVPPDQIDVINKSGQARTASSPILRTAFLQLDQAARSGPNPFTDRP